MIFVRLTGNNTSRNRILYLKWLISLFFYGERTPKSRVVFQFARGAMRAICRLPIQLQNRNVRRTLEQMPKHS